LQSDFFVYAVETIKEAQLPHRHSASATHVFLGSLNDRAIHRTPHRCKKTL